MLEPWEPTSRAQAVVFAVGAGLLLLVALASDGFVPLLDHANLAFHEAGHLIYGIFGETAALYGGTLGQLTFPAVACGIFFVRRKPVSFAAAGGWLFENFFNIARYVADARAEELPLVGGGEHDWANILGRWGALSADTRIARVVVVIGTMGIVALATWVLLRARRR